MNLKKINAFVQVIDRRSFSEAAEALNLTQPAVSQQIKSLEDDLGISLLSRTTSHIEPTAAGRHVYKVGQELLNRWKELEESIHFYRGTLSGTLKVGASTIPGTYLVPRWYGAFYQSHPNVDVYVEVADSETILSKLLYKQVDIGVVGVQPSLPELNYYPVGEDALVLIISRNHPLQELQIIHHPDELLPYPFILRESGSGTRKSSEEWLQHYGKSLSDLRTVAHFSSTEAIITAVENGLGIAFVSQLAANPAAKAGRVHMLPLATAVARKMFLVVHELRKEHPLIKNFTAIVTK